jgi:uncharacterized integral membrane protein
VLNDFLIIIVILLLLLLLLLVIFINTPKFDLIIGSSNRDIRSGSI